MGERDATDTAILNAVLADARLSYRQIAKKAGVSVTTVMHRLKALEQDKIIRQYTADLDYEKLGYDIAIQIDVRVSKGKLFEVEKRLAHHPNIVALYDITGDFDCLIIAKFKTRRTMDNFLKRIQTYPFIERIRTSLILNIIKEKRMEVAL